MFIGGLIGFDLARWARGKHTWPQMSADEIEDAVESVGSEACCSVADRCGEVETIDAYAQSIDANLKKMKAKYFVEAIAQAKTTRRETRRLTQAWSVASLYLNETHVPVAAFFSIETESGDWDCRSRLLFLLQR